MQYYLIKTRRFNPPTTRQMLVAFATTPTTSRLERATDTIDPNWGIAGMYAITGEECTKLEEYLSVKAKVDLSVG